MTVPKKQNIEIGSEPGNKNKVEGRTNACNKKATWKELVMENYFCPYQYSLMLDTDTKQR